jgi:acetolactate synthase-1/2/3 large subunit
MGLCRPKTEALRMIDIDKPRIDWLAMAKSMGCTAIRVNSAEASHAALVQCNGEPGPALTEVCL